VIEFTEAPGGPDAAKPGKICLAGPGAPPATGTGHELSLPLTGIIPTLNAAQGLGRVLTSLRGTVAGLVVADCGSTDATPDIAAQAGATLVQAPRGRGTQLAAGAAAAPGPWLLFLHADTIPGPGWREAAARFVAEPANAARAAHFRFALDDPSPQARRLERWVARRCRWLALPYGDQGLLIHRSLYDAIGGFRPIPLMEDVDIVRRLGRHRLVALDAPFVTSAERWRREGWLRRSRRNLACLALWFLGVSPERIARRYRRGG
jgi:rSAM/selenodomain-associated transferase 2